MVGAARAEAARLLRDELGGIGIDVCEVVVGEHLIVIYGWLLILKDRWHPGMLDHVYTGDRGAKIASTVMPLARSCLLRLSPGELSNTVT